MNEQGWSSRSRALPGRVCLLGAVAVTLGALAACGGRDAGPNAGELEGALAQLTQSAVPAVGTPAAGAVVLATEAQVASDAATQEAFIQGIRDAGAPVPDQLLGQAAATPGDPVTQYKNAQAEANATAGIADVTDLVMSMPRLATFTPEPGGPRGSGELLYLRNGTFYRASAAAAAAAGGGQPLALENADMPPVWAPPDDPGKAWQSPDGRHVAFFAGSDAALWVMETSGTGNHAVSGSNLPTELHSAEAAGGTQPVRLRPGKDYTLVYLPGATEPLSVLVDDNSYVVRGNGRLRVVHAAEPLADQDLVVYLGGQALGGPMSYGRANGLINVPTGDVQLEIRDGDGNAVTTLPAFALGEKEIKTIFLTGEGDEIRGVPATYDPGEPAGLYANTRVFNAGAGALDLTLDGSHKLAGGLAGGTLGPYVRVPATLSVTQHEEMQVLLYGLRGNEHPVAWSPDSRRLAFLSVGDGKVDLYTSDVQGPAERLTDDPLRELNPIWSPDGRSLAWLAEDELSSTYNLYLWREGDAEPRQVDLAPVRQAAAMDPTQKIYLPEDVVWVDNDRLAFFPGQEFRDSLGVWLADARSGAVTALYADPVDELDWSPSARAWAFSSDPAAGKLAILTAGGEMRPLGVEGTAHHPQWTPDGKALTYAEGDPVGSQGWRLHLVNADGTGDRVLTDWWPLVQGTMPAPGPDAKRFWLDDGKVLVFSRVGRDYGAAERSGIGRQMAAGPDLENFYVVRVDGQGQPAEPEQLTDLTQVFYLDKLTPSPDQDTLAFIGLWYASRVQQLWAVPAEGGKPVQIDGPVRWFAWLN